jgi:hypothetical protein
MNQNKYIWYVVAIFVLILALLYLGRTPTSVQSTNNTPPVSVSEQTYASSTFGFSIQYSLGYSVDENYRYQALGPGKDISGVRFIIPSSMATGTNLSPDSYLSVERILGAKNCNASLFLGEGSSVHTIVDGVTTYLVASSTGAAAGNRYEETVYTLPGNPCIAVRYMIHYSVFENYPKGMVHEFDHVAILHQFDEIRRTLVVSAPNVSIPRGTEAKININIVCEGALAYMRFADAASAATFVTECKEGKHPEVIEHFKASLNTDSGVAI